MKRLEFLTWLAVSTYPSRTRRKMHNVRFQVCGKLRLLIAFTVLVAKEASCCPPK